MHGTVAKMSVYTGSPANDKFDCTVRNFYLLFTMNNMKYVARGELLRKKSDKRF